MSKVKGVILPRDLKQITTFDSNNEAHLSALTGLGIDISNTYGMDSSESFITGGVSANISNLRNFLPGIVKNVTTVRKIDELLGQVVVGNWSDEEVIQTVEDRTATVKPYGDGVDVPFTSYNMDFERRTQVRFVVGIKSELLSDERIRASGGNPEEAKKTAATLALEIVRNQIGFYGYNNGANRTYGFLNDPNLPAYNTLPNGAGGDSEWNTKTFSEKQLDVSNAISSLMVSSGGNFDPSMDNFTFAIPLSVATTLTIVNEFGISIQKWINETYPKCRIIYVPELDSANGGANVFYMYVETLKGDSTDNGRVFDQIFSTKMMSIGRGQEIGGYKEGFVNALSGVMLKRPTNVYRATGM